MFKTTIRGVNLQISPGQQETHWGKERNWTVPEDWNETFQQDVFQRFNVDLPSTNGPKWFVEIVHEHQWGNTQHQSENPGKRLFPADTYIFR